MEEGSIDDLIDDDDDLFNLDVPLKEEKKPSVKPLPQICIELPKSSYQSYLNRNKLQKSNLECAICLLEF